METRMRSGPARYARLGGLTASALAGAVLTLNVSGALDARADEPEPVVIRLVADHPPPPHPAALSQAHFQKRLPEVIPGSELRVFHAGALYTIPEALEAMSAGDLEMTWGQFGKTAASDLWMNVVAGPMLVTTPAALEQLDKFETIAMLKERFADLHDVKVFGTAHMSMYMGAGANERLRTADDFKGRKIRSMGPAENAALSAWGASPVTMTFGDVPPALQTGVLDGLLTSLGGWNSVRDQAPFYTVAGVNGIVGDYYWIGASQQWWDSLSAPTQQALETLIVDEVLPLQAQINWCNDKRLLDQFGTDDPAKPGIYVLSDDEREALADALGDATIEWVKANSPEDAHPWVDRFVEEARAASAAHPMGTSEMEQTDCSTLAHLFPQN
jgi:TRAP-type C4-dicarboxylate transport system substrate-binding protein